MKFQFDVELAKAERSADGKLYLEGVASTTDLDKQRERMAPSALADMAKAINIPLTDSHDNEVGNNIGTVISTQIKNNQLIIKAEVDGDDHKAVRLWKKIESGKAKAGFSVGGKITSDKPGTDRNTRRVITGVELDHIMLTAKPANANTFAVALAKSLDELDQKDAELSDVPPQDTLDKSQGEHSMEIDLAKAGATFSAATGGTLKEIHDAGDATVKAKIRALLGDNADDILGTESNLPDGDEIEGAPAGGPVAGKSGDDTAEADRLAKEAADKEAADKLAKEAADKEAADALAKAEADKAELAKTIKDVAQDIVKELLKTAPQFKGATGGSTVSTDESNTATAEEMTAAMLAKSIRF
jgi:hypothetical protein